MAADDLSSKEFLAELSSITAGIRQSIEAKERNMDPSPEAIKARRKRVLGGDYEFFVYMYFPHHMWLDENQKPSEFQKMFMNWLPKALALWNGWKHWFVAPRGEAKSTLATKLAPVYIAILALLQDEDIRKETGLKRPETFIDYVILFGAEAKMPAKTLEVVKTELMNNPHLALDFPEVCKPSAVWKIGEFVTPQGVRFESRGADQSVRGAFHGGSRPKLLLLDDIITDAEAKSPVTREARWDFLEAAVQYLGPPDGTVKFIGVNTVLHNDDPISRASKAAGHIVHVFKAMEKFPDDMDKWGACAEMMLQDDKDFEKRRTAKGEAVSKDQYPSYKYWLKNKRVMSTGAKTSWPSVRGLYELMAMWASNTRQFNREMQGIARGEGEQIFHNISFWVNKLDLWKPYGGCDPSMGKNEKADPSAITVGFQNIEDQALHVEFESRKRRGPTKLVSDLVRAQQEYNCLRWGFENNNAFEYMRTQFKNHALKKDVTLPLFGITATVSQMERAESLELYITDIPANILFHTRCKLLVAELEAWPDKPADNHFDLICALWLMWTITRKKKLKGSPGKSRRAPNRSKRKGYNS